MHGEKVPAADKLVSLFEPHSDIIVKSRRQVSYGHKLNLASGASGLILDIVVEQGNPADAERFVPMVDRQIAIYGRPPRQLAADGGCASTGCSAPGSLDTSLSHAAGLIEIAACHA